MRHGIMHTKLGRTHNHRKALFLNLTKAIIAHQQIETTITKAKVLRPMIERLITKAREVDLATRRYLLTELHQDERSVNALFAIAAKNIDRPGGYTRIVRSRVKDDKTQMAFIEFVDKV